jgi:hypothetical protein
MEVRGWPACRVITPVVYAAAIVSAAAGTTPGQDTGAVAGRELS